MHDAERGLFELGRGRPLLVTKPDGQESEPTLVATVEGLTLETLTQIQQFHNKPVRLVVTHHRAEVMGFTHAIGAACNPPTHQRGGGVSIGLTDEIRPDQILHLSSARETYTTDSLDLRAASAPEAGGITLARLARLLPAIVSAPVDADKVPALRTFLENGSILAATTAHIDAMTADSPVALTHVSDGLVPLAEIEDTRFMLFREANGIFEHVAVLIGSREHWPDPVPVRIHSACFTGDLFGSLRCDCGEQLRGSLRHFAAHGGGVLLYLAQEGRGIGLGNKLRAYSLQQQNLDTVEADNTLGFDDDERQFDAAVQMLQHLQIERVQLLTNNPNKVQAVQDAGIQVIDRQPIYGTLNDYNLSYVKTKATRSGHWLSELLSGAATGK
jgi:GTP cyclohydrolase II